MQLRLEQDKKDEAEHLGAESLKMVTYAPGGHRRQITSFYDKAEGTATKLDVMTQAVERRSRESKSFKH